MKISEFLRKTYGSAYDFVLEKMKEENFTQNEAAVSLFVLAVEFGVNDALASLYLMKIIEANRSAIESYLSKILNRKVNMLGPMILLDAIDELSQKYRIFRALRKCMASGRGIGYVEQAYKEVP